VGWPDFHRDGRFGLRPGARFFSEDDPGPGIANGVAYVVALRLLSVWARRSMNWKLKESAQPRRPSQARGEDAIDEGDV